MSEPEENDVFEETLGEYEPPSAIVKLFGDEDEKRKWYANGAIRRVAGEEGGLDATRTRGHVEDARFQLERRVEAMKEIKLGLTPSLYAPINDKQRETVPKIMVLTEEPAIRTRKSTYVVTPNLCLTPNLSPISPLVFFPADFAPMFKNTQSPIVTFNSPSFINAIEST